MSHVMSVRIEHQLRAMKWRALVSPVPLLTGGRMLKVRKTKVEAYLEKHEKRVAANIHAAITRAGKRVKAKVLAFYATHLVGKLAKLTPEEKRVIDELDAQIDANGVGVAVSDAFGDDLRAVFRQAGLTALAEVNIEAGDEIVNSLDASASLYAAKRGGELVTQISDTTREDIAALVGDAVDGGWSTDTLSSALDDAMAFGEARSTMIARTELAFAHVQGNLEGWVQSGEVAEKSWLASADACPICEDMDGETVDLDASFDFDGEEVDGPPGHPNCRCDVLPVLKPEEDQPEE